MRCWNSSTRQVKQNIASELKKRSNTNVTGSIAVRPAGQIFAKRWATLTEVRSHYRSQRSGATERPELPCHVFALASYSTTIHAKPRQLSLSILRERRSGLGFTP